VSAGKRISGSRIASTFHNGEIGVLNPRTWNSEGKLQGLVYKSAEKSREHKCISRFFGKAPIDKKNKSNKCSLLTENGNMRKNKVQNRISDTFEKVK
jgi:hypothetical protein